MALVVDLTDRKSVVPRQHRHAQLPMRPPNPFAPRSYGDLERVTDRVYLWRNIVNSTIFVGDHGLAVVDTQVNQAGARRLLSVLREQFAVPVRYAINTHYHWDHTAGNSIFQAAGAVLVASRRTGAAIAERQPRQKSFLASRGFELGPDPTGPDLLAEDQPNLDLGGLHLHLTPGLRAESSDPLLVRCPDQGVLASGDSVMTGSFPIFGQPSQDEGLRDDGWLAALAEIRASGLPMVCPGHGPVARGPELDLLERICRYFLDTVRTHHAAGRDLAGTIRVMEDEMPAWITRIPEVWGTPRYAILRVWSGLTNLGQPGWQHVKPSAIPRHADAVAAQADLAGWEALVSQAQEGGDQALAVSAAEAATAALPLQPGAWTLAASAYIAASRGIASVLEKGDCFDAARTALNRALALDPNFGPALLQRGQYHVMVAFRNGDDPTDGEEHLDRAASWPGLTIRQRAEVVFYRGIAARTRGDEPGAKACFGAALQTDPSFMPALLAGR